MSLHWSNSHFIPLLANSLYNFDVFKSLNMPTETLTDIFSRSENLNKFINNLHG